MKYIISILSIFFALNLTAQESGRITYKAYFAKPEATEELRQGNIIRYQEKLDEEMMADMLTFNLDFKDSESLFYLGNNAISELEDQARKKYVTGLFYGFDKLYVDRDEDLLLEQLYYTFETLLISRKASFPDWNLTSDIKTINGYKCYKATYTYIQKWRGREFPWEIIAWYCPDIPLKFGPIRYSGLPGLILELVEDDRGFIVDTINLNEKNVEIKRPSEGELITEKELNKKHLKEKEELEKRINTDKE